MTELKRLTPADLRASEKVRVRQNLAKKETRPEAREQASFTYYTNTSKKKSLTGLRKSKKVTKSLPLIALIGVAFGVIVLFNFISSPLSTMARLATDTFNTQDVVMDSRLNQLLDYKLNNDPVKPTKYNIVADYRTITSELDSSLRKKQVVLDQNKRIATFNGKTILGDQFLANLNSDISLIKATNDATAVRRNLFQDETWYEYKTQAKLNQSGIKANNKDKTIQEQETDITKSDTSGFRFSTGGDSGNGTINQLNAISQNLSELNQTADQLEETQATPNGKSFVNLILVDKPNDTCGLYQTSRATQNYQKTAQTAQLSKLASLLLTEADKTKAGIADSEVINYINDRLTYSGTYIDGNGQVREQRSAMDSYAQRYLMNGTADAPDSSAQKYIIGANEPLAKTMSALKANGESDNCSSTSSFSNFFMNIFNFIIGRQPSNEATQYLTYDVKNNTTATNLSAMTGLATAPDFSGEDLANGFASGVADIMNKNAKNSGMMALTQNQAVAYLTEQQNLIAKRAEIDRKTLSPFDTSSPYTFLGSIVAQLNLTSSQNNLPSKFSSFTLIAKQSISSIGKPALASTSQIQQNLEYCYDQEYREANPEIALGPYCNLIYGAPLEVLDKDPESVVHQLVESGNLKIVEDSCDDNGYNCDLESARELLAFEENCVARDIPIGNSNDNFSKGDNCVANSDIEKLFPIFLADQRINTNLKRQAYNYNNRPASGNDLAPSGNITTQPVGRNGSGIVNLSEYRTVHDNNGKIDVASFSSQVIRRGVFQAYDKLSWGDLCLSFAYYHSYHLWHNTPNAMIPAQAARYGYILGYRDVKSASKSVILQEIYNSIMQGSPAILMVNGNRIASSRHFVSVVGFKRNVTSASDLREEDLLILDSWDGRLETMDANKSRWMYAQNGNWRAMIMKNVIGHR